MIHEHIPAHVLEHDEHSESLFHELLHHFPYAIFSVSFGLILLSFLTHGTITSPEVASEQAHALFHNFHFLHIIFAATGTVVTYLRFSKNILNGLLIGIISPAIFCTLSDSILPYLGGRMLGVDMHWHLCFYSELPNVLPFLFVGVINGFVMGKHHYAKLAAFSVGSHFIHILVSSLASCLYLLSYGFSNWSESIGAVFLFLIFAVLLPCTLSDVVVPMLFAKAHKKK
jgi:hypothetical protein